MENKPLHTVNTMCTEEMLRWANLKNGRVKSIIGVVVFFVGGLLGVFSGSHLSLIIGCVALLGSVLTLMLKFVVLPRSVKRVARSMEENGEVATTFEFYEDHVVRTNATGTYDAKYANFIYYRENDRWIAINYPVNKIVMVDKADCDPETIDFIRSITPAENQAKTLKKIRKNNIIFVLILILFLADLYFAYRIG